MIAADVAKYDLDSAAEATQGAGAVAMLVSADPALVEIEPATGVFTADVDDFWRPNDRSTAVVDGKLSIVAYLDALVGAFDDYRAHGGVGQGQEFGRAAQAVSISRAPARLFLAELSIRTGTIWPIR